MNCRSNIAARN